MRPRTLQPALLGGVFLGVLSALPVIGAGNLCCCLWIVGGGIIASYLMQQGHPLPITLADGALVGLLAGLFGAIIWTAVSIPLGLWIGPIQAAWMERALDRVRDLPPQLRGMLESARYGSALSTLALIFGLVFRAMVGAVFSMIGGVLGALFFRSSPPPPASGAIEVLPPDGS